MLQTLFNRPQLKDFLINKGLVSEEDWFKVVEISEADDISEVIAAPKAFGYNQDICKAIAEYVNAPYVPLRELPKISQEILREIPRSIVASEKVFPFAYGGDNGTNKNIINVAMPDPSNLEILENLELRTGKEFKAYLGSLEDIEMMISQYLGASEALEAANAYTEALEASELTERPVTADVLSADSPVLTVVNSIIEQAAKAKASDIHIEPFQDYLRIRYRVDGALTERPSFPIKMHPAIIARLKVMGNMDIAEKRIPQDGRITYDVDGVEYDIRASMLPTVFGEKCVMRLAVRTSLNKDKKDLGLTQYDLKIFDKVFANPNGIILVTGPTGSGKSTTLYTALSELSTEEVNVVTVEDPVEANVTGVNQVQTNAKAGMTFAAALRSILRQDPDIIMIGEIRDEETAEIAVQAAITGHLVVSTLHTNSSSATVTRLINMGLAPYLVADSVVGILAQRLVRRLCNRCKKPHVATKEELEELGINISNWEKSGSKPITIYEKGGCPYCNNTGYKGRIAVYEIMDVGPEIKAMIVGNAKTSEIKRVAVENGMHTLHRSAAERVVQGITTISEMRKVSNES